MSSFDDYDYDVGEEARDLAYHLPRLLSELEEMPFFHLGVEGDELKDALNRFVTLIKRFPKNIKADAEMLGVDEAYLYKLQKLVDYIKVLNADLESVAYAEPKFLNRAAQKAKNMASAIDQKTSFYTSWVKNELGWSEFLYESRKLSESNLPNMKRGEVFWFEGGTDIFGKRARRGTYRVINSGPDEIRIRLDGLITPGSKQDQAFVFPREGKDVLDYGLNESRSRRKPAFYQTTNVNPARGKKTTSRSLRRTDTQMMHDIKKEVEALNDDELLDEVDEFFDDPRFSSRGSAGSKSPDHGWDDFGDGKLMADIENYDESFRYKLTRK
jgi:hypothetical protein